MASWADLLEGLGGGSTVEQLFIWNVVGAVVSTILQPALTLLGQQVAAVAATAGEGQALSPDVLADLVVRGFTDQSGAAGAAAESGITATDFALMVANAADAPSPGELAEALRRGLIPEDSGSPSVPGFVQGIQQGRLGDKWVDMIKGLAQVWPTPNDALQAYLEGQIDEATATTLYQRFGGDPDYFQMLYDTRGNAPTPMEAIEMLRRGLIPASGTGPDSISYQQAFLEGPWRNKWLAPFQALANYVPPPRTVTALVRTGAITDAEAQGFFQDAGMSPDLAAAYLKSTNGEKMEGTRTLAQGVILQMYEAQAIDQATATGYLNTLGYTDTQAAFLLELYDLRREIAALNKAINRVGTLYTNHKVTRSATVNFLAELGVVGAHQDQIMATWDLQAAAEVKLPTITDIGKALKYGAITADEALTEAQRLGYSEWDAYIALSAAAEMPTGTKPSSTPTPPGTI